MIIYVQHCSATLTYIRKDTGWKGGGIEKYILIIISEPLNSENANRSNFIGGISNERFYRSRKTFNQQLAEIYSSWPKERVFIEHNHVLFKIKRKLALKQIIAANRAP